MTVAKYIGRLDNETRADDVKSLLEEKGVDVVSIDPIQAKHERFKSFKLVVKRSQLSIVEDEELWPTGVIVGRFWSPKSTDATRNSPS